MAGGGCLGARPGGENPGAFSLAPFNRGEGNLTYGPTGSLTENGAHNDTFLQLDGSQGVTLEGFFAFPGNASAGTLVGFVSHSDIMRAVVTDPPLSIWR